MPWPCVNEEGQCAPDSVQACSLIIRFLARSNQLKGGVLFVLFSQLKARLTPQQLEVRWSACGQVHQDLLTYVPLRCSTATSPSITFGLRGLEFPLNNSKKQTTGARVSVVISHRHNMFSVFFQNGCWAKVCLWLMANEDSCVSHILLGLHWSSQNGQFCGVLMYHVIKIQISYSKFV